MSVLCLENFIAVLLVKFHNETSSGTLAPQHVDANIKSLILNVVNFSKFMFRVAIGIQNNQIQLQHTKTVNNKI